jgi:hypothetical protein
MVEQVKQFMEGADWKQIALEFSDFNEAKQAALRKVMSQCGQDFDYPLNAKPYDTEHENFKYFAMCLRNNVSLNPALNGSRGIRSSVLGYQF